MTDNITHSEKQSRRDFLNYVLGIGVVGWLSAILYPLYQYLKPPKAPEVDVSNIKLGNVADFQNNSSKIRNRKKILLDTPYTGITPYDIRMLKSGIFSLWEYSKFNTI